MDELDYKLNVLDMVNKALTRESKCTEPICPMCGCNELKKKSDQYGWFFKYRIDELFYGQYECCDCGYVMDVMPEYTDISGHYIGIKVI